MTGHNHAGVAQEVVVGSQVHETGIAVALINPTWRFAKRVRLGPHATGHRYAGVVHDAALTVMQPVPVS